MNFLTIKPYTLILLLAVLAAAPARAQQELMLHSLPDVWHSNSTNPAFFPENKHFVIGLPGIGLDAAHSGDISYNDIFVKDGDRTVMDFGNALDKLDPENKVFFDQRIETVSLGLRLPGKIWLHAAHANRLSGIITYPETLPRLIWEGNGQYVGQTVEIAPQTDMANWNEWSLGLAKGIGKLRLAARFKLLTGTAAIKSDPDHHSASVFTSDDIYQLTLKTDYGFHAASVIDGIDTSGLGFDVNIGSLKGKAFSPNAGYAFDLGATFQATKNLSVDVSLLDVGGIINWKQKANYFRSQGEYTYDGITLPGSDIINGADSLDFSNKLDTLNDIFNFNKTAQNFATTLPLRGYAGLRYDLGKRLTFGLSLYWEKRESEKAKSAFGLSAQFKPVKWVSVGAMYSINDRSASNLGLHLALKPGPVQVYFASDNLINAFSVKGRPAVNLRTGLSLLF